MENFQPFVKLYEEVIHTVHLAGGRFIFVGGCVRDILLGLIPKDYDAEVYGLSLEQLEKVLTPLGPVSEVGKSFGVLKLKNYPLDISVPRLDKKTHSGHRGFSIHLNSSLSFKEAARRRDLTINSMGYDPLKNQLLDPFNGRHDLKEGILRATDPKTFPEDPLRGLRVAQFSARFLMLPNEELKELCVHLNLGELPPERVSEEIQKLLVKGQKPSWGLHFLVATHLADQFFPELAQLSEKPWENTLKAVDKGARNRGELLPDFCLTFMLTLLGSEIQAASFQKFLQNFKFPSGIIEKVYCLLTALNQIKGWTEIPAGRLPYFQVGKNLVDNNLSWKDLLGILKAVEFSSDKKSLITQKVFEYGALNPQNILPIVQGRHLIERGFSAGPEFKSILDKCLEIQYVQGLTGVQEILKQLKES